MHYSDQEIFQGIHLKDNKILNYVYKSYFPNVRSFIFNNTGNEEDAKDIFQEALIAIFKTFRDKQFKIECSFNTYLYAVCRNLWLKQLKNNKKNPTINWEINEERIYDLAIETSEEFNEVISENARAKLFHECFNELAPDCKEVLNLFLKKVPLKKIAEEMGYASEGYAKKRKYACKEMLIKKINKNLNNNF